MLKVNQINFRQNYPLENKTQAKKANLPVSEDKISFKALVPVNEVQDTCNLMKQILKLDFHPQEGSLTSKQEFSIDESDIYKNAFTNLKGFFAKNLSEYQNFEAFIKQASNVSLIERFQILGLESNFRFVTNEDKTYLIAPLEAILKKEMPIKTDSISPIINLQLVKALKGKETCRIKADDGIYELKGIKLSKNDINSPFTGFVIKKIKTKI